ncbi:hypothetical protein BJY01DRAFT_215187 [Aspergillus pseudoustus]|uniref:Uncharacterized protein n=1 Tax=Aspergillus pseudoustus TaxID=1810923 RepID=A0ABR4JVR9_9EURO
MDNHQSASEMLNLNTDDANGKKSSKKKGTDVDFDFAKLPNDMVSFPEADGSGPDKPTTKKPQQSKPVRSDEDKDGEDKDKNEDDGEESKPTPSSSAAEDKNEDDGEESKPTPSSSAGAASSSKPSTQEGSEQGGESEGEERGLKKNQNQPAADKVTPKESAEKPKVSAEKPKQPEEDKGPLDSLPLFGSLTKGLLGGAL